MPAGRRHQRWLPDQKRSETCQDDVNNQQLHSVLVCASLTGPPLLMCAWTPMPWMGAPLSSRSRIKATYSAALLPWIRMGIEPGFDCFNLFSGIGYDGVVVDKELQAGVLLVSPLVHLDPGYQNHTESCNLVVST